MQHSKMVIVWKGIQSLEHLKILNLSHSKRLRSTPDFTKVQMLVMLILEGCISLLEIHPSVGNLGSLQFLNLENCKEIKTIPDEICNLKLLGYLNLNGCSKLEGLPENLGEIETLRELYADETAIKQLPSSLGLLKNLTSLSLKGCNKKSATRSWFPFLASRESSDAIRFVPSISGLRALRRFNLRDCNLCDQEIPVDIGSLYALQELDLTGNSLSSLPQSFKHLTNLESLYLDNWNDLCSLPELPSSLRSLAPTTSQSRQYNVFLSFRDSDTRDTFSNNHCTALVEAEIHAYRDDHELNVGGIVSHELIPAIDESRIAIIVFSTNYAASTWCLDNLVRIIECQRTMGKVVLPIFYHVDQGSFAEAFQKHTAEHVGELDKVERWQSALSYTADLSGFSLQDFNGSESSLISHIIKEVQWELKRLFVAKHPVGLESRSEEVQPLLQLETNEVCVIEIRGEVGSGKTVIAKALYNESLEHFDSSCFLADIGTVSARPNGLVYLQNQLLYQLGMGENVKVESVAEVIKKMCGHKKVLIVLDDVDEDEQAYALVVSLNWYGSGSRIIFVMRRTWSYHFPTKATYSTQWFCREEWMELLSWHAFGTATLPADYVMLAEQFEGCWYDGNPLAIVVLGTYLYGRSIHECESAAGRTWELNPYAKELDDIHDILGGNAADLIRNARNNLDLIRTAYVIEVLNGCGGAHLDFGVKSLLDKCFPPNWGNDPRVQELLPLPFP